MVAKLTVPELAELTALSNLEEQIIYLCQKFDLAQSLHNETHPQMKVRAMELHSDFLSRSVVVQISFPLESDVLAPDTVSEIFPSLATTPAPTPMPTPTATPAPTPAPAIPAFLPYIPTALSNAAYYSAETSLGAINDGSSDTSQPIEVQRGPNGMIEFNQPLALKITFDRAVKLTRLRILCGQFNGYNYNRPDGFKLYQGETTTQLVYAFSDGFVAADGLAFREFDLTGNAANSNIYRIDFTAPGGISIYEMQFWGV
jgi:hypothetical protein